MNFDGNFLKIYFVVGTLALIYFLFFRGGFLSKQRATKMTSKQFLLATQRDAADPTSALIDLRTAKEFQTGSIPGAIDIDVSRSSMKSSIDALPRDKTYYIYCNNGEKSATYAHYLINSGFKNISYLENGFDEWLRLGYPINTDKPHN